jgi:hypothetical protein
VPALAEWFVEINTKGGEKAAQDIAKTGKALEKGEGFAKKYGAAIGTAFTVGLAAITAFVKMGLSGTEEGEAMTEAFSALSSALASIFFPIVEAITAGITFLAETLEEMGGVGQTVFLALTAAAAAFWAYLTGGILPILVTLGLAAGIVAKVATGGADKKTEVTKKGEKASFEDPAAVWKRIQQTAVGGGGDKQQQMVDEQKKTNNLLAGKVSGEIVKAINDQKPPVKD